MTLTYNDITSPRNMVTFSDVYNIIDIHEEPYGSYATITIPICGVTSSVEGQYYITLLGETITSTITPQNAGNKLFYIANGDDESTAISIVRAFRNCSRISANYTVVKDGSSVVIKSRTIGRLGDLSNVISTNLQINYTIQDGAIYTQLYDSTILADVYFEDQYAVSLTKSFYGTDCFFDMSPMLATYSEYGKLIPYRIDLSAVDNDGAYTRIGTVSGYTTNGYIANMSERYKYLTTSPQIMLNIGEGETIHTCGDIDLTFMCSTSFTISTQYYDLSGNVSTEYTETATPTNGLYEYQAPLSIADAALYDRVVVSAGSETIEFNVIHPVYAAERVERIEWRNENGGISFFDFTGKRTETESLDVTTYKKSPFDYYTAPTYEEEKVYRNNETKTVKVTSHLLKKDAIWIFNSLSKAKNVWTVVGDGIINHIIVTNVEVTEDSNYNDIYKATITYKYSYNQI